MSAGNGAISTVNGERSPNLQVEPATGGSSSNTGVATYTRVIQRVRIAQPSRSSRERLAMAREVQETDWTAVIARTLGFLCIHQAKLQNETLLKQAEFLERFGIPRSEAGPILGSSEKSLNDMERAQQKARATKTTAKKTTTKRAPKRR